MEVVRFKLNTAHPALATPSPLSEEELIGLISNSVLTSTIAARILGCCARTVCKWIDGGELSGYRIPGSRDRRVPKEALAAFVRENNIPVYAAHLAEIAGADIPEHTDPCAVISTDLLPQR